MRQSRASVVALIALLAGCASTPTATSPAPATATVGCPIEQGIELPPGCIPYDPEAAMAENERYRERIELDEAATSENTRAAGPVLAALEALRTGGEVTVDGVERTLEEAGLSDVQVLGSDGRVAFGAKGPAGGCLFGGATTDVVTVEVGGYIRDGGCLANEGH